MSERVAADNVRVLNEMRRWIADLNSACHKVSEFTRVLGNMQLPNVSGSGTG